MRNYDFEIGMHCLAPGMLSEVELLKWLGHFQWSTLCASFGRSSKDLCGADGKRLYAAFVFFELCFPHGTLSRFEEGDSVHVANAVAHHKKRLIDGAFLLDRAPIQRDAAIRYEALAKEALPWAYTGNIFVAPDGGNSRLRAGSPAGVSWDALPELDEPPSLVQEQENAREGVPISVGPWQNAIKLPISNTNAVSYPIVPESNLNGAGLLYFARYVTILNYAERIFLTGHPSLNFSRPLVARLSTSHRKIFYYGNAGKTPQDTLLVRVTAAGIRFVSDAERQAFDMSPEHRADLLLNMSMYRASDGMLIAMTSTSKALMIPPKNRVLEAELARCRRGLDTSG